MAAKYKEYVDRMFQIHQELFSEFARIHELYSQDDRTHQEEFNRVGEKVMRVVREFEAKLCATQEKTYSQFTSRLAEKFQNEIRRHFPLIDHVGIIVKKPTFPNEQPAFAIRKIKLS